MVCAQQHDSAKQKHFKHEVKVARGAATLEQTRLSNRRSGVEDYKEEEEREGRRSGREEGRGEVEEKIEVGGWVTLSGLRQCFTTVLECLHAKLQSTCRATRFL